MTIIVSSGPGDATIPFVRGSPRAQAERRLKAAGFRVDVRREFNEDVPPNRVIETSPSARSRLERGRTVTLVVSRGPRKVEVRRRRRQGPRRGRAAARGARAAGHLHRARGRGEGARAPSSQMSPAAGSEVARGTTVTLTVAKEPRADRGPRRARRGGRRRGPTWSRRAGFRVRRREQKVDSPEGDGVVLEQNPPSGEKRDEGSRVTLTVGALRAGEPRPRSGRHALADALRVVVLAGGRSSEHDVSLDSAATVTEALRAGGHEVETVLLERDGGWTGPGGEPLALVPGGGLLGADVVFPVLHGPFGEDGTIQGLLELLDVAYVGAGVLASVAVHGQDRLQGGAGRRRGAAGGLRRRARDGVARGRRRGARAARGAGAARCSSSRRGSAPRSGISKVSSDDELDAGARDGVRPRRARDRRGVLAGDRGRVLGDGARRPRGLAAGRGRPAGRRLVRLRGQVLAGRRRARDPAADRRRGDRGGAAAGARDVPARGLRRARARRLLRRGRTACSSTSSTRCRA